jgi:hypothetical protein
MTRGLQWRAWMVCSVVLFWAAATQAQTASASTTTTPLSSTVTVPRLIRYAGVAHDKNGKPLSGVVGITFSLYAEEAGGAALWMETQNVQADGSGHYSVLLGSTKPDGLPADIFASEQARWIGVQIEQRPEQSRTLLVSAPYALKAGDAETLGGLPPSAFVLAAPATAHGDGSSSSATPAANGEAGAPNSSSNVTTTGGTANTIPMFTTATNIQNSILTQTGATAVNVAGKLNLPATGTATATKGFNSQPQDFVASVFSKSTSKAVPQTFAWQAEPTGNNTTTASGTLNLLYGSGTAAPAETGLKISNKGVITFVASQTFPGLGTITGVTAGTDLTGGGTTGTVTLNLDTTKVPQLAAANTFTGNQAVTGNLSATGTITATGTVTGGTVASNGAVTAVGDVHTDSNGKNAGSYTPGIRFGAGSTGEAISSKRTAGGNQSGLDFYTAAIPRMSITKDGLINIGMQIPNDSAQVLSETSLNYALYGESSNSLATGVLGSATSTSGQAWGVLGITNSGDPDAYGVTGVSNASSGNPVGVYGVTEAPAGVGVFGQRENESSTGQNLETWTSDLGIGVWGDGGQKSDSGIGDIVAGVAGTADDGNAAVFANNSSSGDNTVYIRALGSKSNPLVAVAAGGGYCYVDPSGNLNCTGSKNAVVPIDGGAHIVAMSAIESPVNWFEDAGSARLVNGAAVVSLDRDFIQTVNTDMDYKVFPVPNGDCKGLYVTNKTATSFEVRELGGGTSNVAFDYRIMAVRRNYETVRFADHTHDMDSMKMMEERAKALGAKPINHDPKKKLLPLNGNSLTRAAAGRPITGAAKKN